MNNTLQGSVCKSRKRCRVVLDSTPQFACKDGVNHINPIIKQGNPQNTVQWCHVSAKEVQLCW